MSLPGAGETESTVLQELNRRFVIPTSVSEQQTQQQEGTTVSELESCQEGIDSTDKSGDFDQIDVITETEIGQSDVHGQSIDDEYKSGKSEGVAQQGQIDSETVNARNIERKSSESENKLEKSSKSIDQEIVVEPTSSTFNDSTVVISNSESSKLIENLKETQSNDISEICEVPEKIVSEKIDSFNHSENIVFSEELEKLNDQKLDNEIILDFTPQDADQRKEITFAQSIDQNTDPLKLSEDESDEVSIEPLHREENYCLDLLKPIDVDEICSSVTSQCKKVTPVSHTDTAAPPTESFEREISPPPVPPITYKWEDVRRAKEKVSKK